MITLTIVGAVVVLWSLFPIINPIVKAHIASSPVRYA